MQFYHDAHRNILVYPTRSPLLLQSVQEAREINGEFIALPHSLRNLQVLKWLNFPVPPVITDANYDWPRASGITPYATQKLTANFMVLNRRCFNLGDMGCVGGETLIDTVYGKQPIKELAERGRPFVVRTLTPEGPRYIEVAAPFWKGCAPLFKVTFKSGRSIVATKQHVFLTSRGWVSCANLAASEQLPVFDVYPQQSNWEPCHVRSRLDAHRLSQIISNSKGDLDIPVYDEPPLSVTNTYQDVIPSLTYALARCHFSWRKDDQGNTHIRTSQISDAHRPTLRYVAHCDQGEIGAFLSGCATKQTCNQFHISAQYHLFPTQLQEAAQDQELRLCIPLDEASDPPFDTVVHIAYERTDAYYDMEVPVHANYVAHGLCNHNSGKTLAALWAADWLMRQHSDFRVLVVAPLSTLQTVWANAIFKHFLNRRTVEILHGSADKRLKTLEKKADVYLCNYDGIGVGAHTRGRMALDGFSRALSERSDIRLVICDEASAYKDAQTKRHRLARQIIGQREYLFLMTGTPTPNAPTDAYGLAKMVNNAHGKSFKTFQSECMYKVSNFKWVPMKDGYDKARKLLDPSIRIDIRDVWDAPAMTTQQRLVALTDQQKKLMADLKRDLQVVVKSGVPITAANEAAARQKFIQISLGMIYDHAHKAHAIDAGSRYEELRSVIEQATGKVLVFAPLTSVVNYTTQFLRKWWTVEMVNGEVSAKDRAQIFDDFQRVDAPRIIVADPQTMAHGLDLYAARTVIWLGSTDKGELYAQANKRAHRPGQKHPVTVVQIVSNKLEQEIYRRLENNESLQGSLLEMVKRGEI